MKISSSEMYSINDSSDNTHAKHALSKASQATPVEDTGVIEQILAKKSKNQEVAVTPSESSVNGVPSQALTARPNDNQENFLDTFHERMNDEVIKDIIMKCKIEFDD